MRCSQCGAENPDRAKFCVECAAPFARRCPSCNAENPPKEQLCLECAQPLESTGKSEPIPASSNSPIQVSSDSPDASLEGERKTVTALFADIKGSTELEQDLDPEEARRIVDPALKLMIDAVRRYDGYVVQSTGDGIFALFGAPAAHEDHPQRALYAALLMQEDLKGYSDKLREAGNPPIEARVGVNTGQVVVRSITTGRGHTEYTPIGHTTNLASRMQTLAPTGSIAISEHTRKFVEGYFELKPFGPTRVKGVSTPVNVYEVRGLGSLRTRLQQAAGRGFTKFVGRRPEMEAIARAAELAKSGQGQIVAVVAGPGVGKSRLFYEFKATHHLGGWTVLEGYSVSFGTASPYLPVIDLLHAYFRIAQEDDARARREKVTRRLLALEPALEGTLPYLFGLLGIVEGDNPLAQMDGQIRRRRTLEAIKQIFLRESLNQPLILVFEDLHWIDGETQELLNLMADSISSSRVLLLLNYRPEYRHDWGNSASHTQLRLQPLGAESAEEMLTALLGDEIEIAPLKRLIIEKTEGTPFFIEETLRTLFEDGTLLRNGQVKITRSLGQLRIPATVEAMLASRIDRLSAMEKRLLQTFAVIGSEFPLSLAAQVAEKSNQELAPILSHLQQREFIYEHLSGVDIGYTFKHALTRQVAYESLLVERRRFLHEKTANALEVLNAGHLRSLYDELASHYQLSGNVGKAIEYLKLAAGQALDRSAVLGALSSLNAALKLVAGLPDSPRRREKELDLLLSKYTALVILVGYTGREVEELNSRLEDLCRQEEDPGRHIAVSFALQSFHYIKGDVARAIAIDKDMLASAERMGDISAVTFADYLMGSKLMYVGKLLEARHFLEKALAEHQPGSLRVGAFGRPDDTESSLMGYLAVALVWLGYPDQATKRAEEGVRRAREISHPWSVAVQLLWKGYVFMQIGRPDSALSAFTEAADISERLGFAMWIVFGRLGQAQSQALLSATDEAISSAKVWRDLWLSKGELCVGFTAIDNAVCFLRAGRVDEARDTVEGALEAVRRTGQLTHEADLLRLRGEISLRRAPDPGAAKKCFEAAIASSRACHSKFYELRATTSLARLLALEGKRDEARAMLADIYNWFTEGFDTADLKEAKALLDELA